MARHDVVVAGSGPAGWAAAVACAEAGLSTLLVAPSPSAAWHPTFSSWVDDLDKLGLSNCLSHRWPVVQAGSHLLSRPYGRIDNARLQRHLIDRAEQAGVAIHQGRSAGVRHERTGSTLLLTDGRSLDATVVVDATGASGSLVQGRGVAPATQTAYGIEATLSEAPSETGCVFMDFSGGKPHDRPPTFLYAQALGEDRWFLEETVLACVVPMPPEQLKAALLERCRQRGIALTDIVEVETVAIPMGLRVPLPQRVVGVGAAGGAIHPATGYSLVTSLGSAPEMAKGIAEALQRRATPEAASLAAWAALWPDTQRRARTLQEYGLDVMMKMSRQRLGAFFDQFFGLSEDDQATYMRSTSSSVEVAAVMSRLWMDVPTSLRVALMKGDLTKLSRAIR